MREGAYGERMPQDSCHTNETRPISLLPQRKRKREITRRDKQETEREVAVEEREFELQIKPGATRALPPCRLQQHRQIDLLTTISTT